jgi:MFS family permease
MNLATNRQRYIGLIVIWLSYIGLYLNRRNVSVALPSIIDEMNLSYSEAGFLISAFFIIYAIAQMPCGWLVDKFGGLRTLVTGNVISAIFGYASGITYNYPSLLVTRIFCGMGQGVGWPASTKLVAEIFPKRRRGVALGILTSGVAVGSFLSLVISAIILEYYGWRSVFFIPALILLFLTFLVWFVIRKHKSQRIEVVKSRFKEIVKDRVIVWSALSYFCWKFGFEGLFYWLPLYFIKAHKFTIGSSGLFAGSIMLIGLLAMPFGGWLSDKVGRRLVIIVSLFVTGILLLALPFEITFVLLILLIISFFFQMSEGVYFAIPVDRFKPEFAGTSVGFINQVGQVGTFLGPFATGILVDIYHSFTPAFFAYALFSFIGIVFIVLAYAKVR